jgi:cytochrome c-type biogenesis protein CcmH/NrfG
MNQRSITISEKDYIIAQRRKIERRQKILTIVSIISFLGSTVFAVVPTLKQAFQNPQPVATPAESSLKQQAHGFELVLQREPENPAALEGSAIAQMNLKNPQGAIAPLEKLVKLYPQNTDYKQVLEQAKKQAGKGGTPKGAGY